MFARIGNTVGCFFLNALGRFAVPVNCAKCGQKFKPFEGHKFTEFSEFLGRFPCPRCGYRFGIGEDAKTAHKESAANPPGPHKKPDNSRIERSEPSADSLLFYLPPAGCAGSLLIMAAMWNALMLPLCYFFVLRGVAAPQAPELGAKIFICVFTAVGLGVLYGALRQKFASHLVYLSPELVRVQRRLLMRSSQDILPAKIQSVKLKEFYSENDVAVYGIEIGAGSKIVRFGSALRADEKRWLAWEIREFLRQHGAAQIPPEEQ